MLHGRNHPLPSCGHSFRKAEYVGKSTAGAKHRGWSLCCQLPYTPDMEPLLQAMCYLICLSACRFHDDVLSKISAGHIKKLLAMKLLILVICLAGRVEDRSCQTSTYMLYLGRERRQMSLAKCTTI